LIPITERGKNKRKTREKPTGKTREFCLFPRSFSHSRIIPTAEVVGVKFFWTPITERKKSKRKKKRKNKRVVSVPSLLHFPLTILHFFLRFSCYHGVPNLFNKEVGVSV